LGLLGESHTQTKRVNIMITYDLFIETQYQELSPLYKKLYESKAKHKANYIKCRGFSEWLESLRDSFLTQEDVYNLAKPFYVHGKRTPATMPNVIASIAKQYNIELPDVYGVLTPAYWYARLGE
jgi:hypothetical protein